METIDFSAGASGVELAGKVTLLGAIQRPTKRHTEAEPDYWHAVRFQAEDGTGGVLQAFCDEETARDAAARLKKAGAPFLADVVLFVTNGDRGTTLNVGSLA